MKNKIDLKLPIALDRYIERIKKSIKPYVEIKGRLGSTLPWESKFRGLPYMPIGFEYPKDSKGEPMILLAQINYSEVPHIEPFPEKGILQFYICKNDDTYGLNWNNLTEQKDFRVIYFPDVVEDIFELVSDFNFIENIDVDMLPIQEEVKLEFNIKYSPVTSGDFQFDKLIGKSLFNIIDEALTDSNNAEDEDKLYDTFSLAGHRMGGYAFFTQCDPREGSHEDHKTLLLQVGSDSDIYIMWGDVGVANLFIKESDLKSLDFSNVLYTWDCC
jgi:Uncharacterized protein conserved in bacteria